MTAGLRIRRAVPMDEGVGAKVKRLMPVKGFMNHDPFVLWDEFSLETGAGFPAHSHRGFEAITYVFQGSVRHEDNLGNRSTVGAGGAQRFTAGRGITHSEMPASQGVSQGIQVWINLPGRLKSVSPDYQQVDAEALPSRSDDAGEITVVVGEGSPLELRTDVRMLDVILDAKSRFCETISAGYRGFAYIVKGDANWGEASISAGEAYLLEESEQLELSTSGACRFMLCLGMSHGEPIRQHGPFVD